ncbi:MAG TPA: methyltransferase domain-containing protein [Acetobacteraceae bacterium]|nr:methyltransferase domain-containing protein [Acetobacteraceae bacterium]
MGDIFRRETAEHPEPFTGERLTASIGGQVQIEHYHRYLFARSLVAGRDVLDVASGEGYGSALLAQVARLVIGVEHSGPTVRTAAGNFPRPNLQFLQGDARALPLTDGCVDTVVSFETIEHFDRQHDFLREVRRVLRPDGSFIVSTPDRDIYSPAGTPVNPFHVRELSRSEFAALLRGAFRHVQIMWQRAMIGSALLADTGSAAPALVFDRRGDTHFEACIGLPRAPYLIAVASDRELPPLPPSLYIDRGDLDTELLHRLAIAKQLRQVQADLAQATQRAEQATQRAEQATLCAEQAAQRAEQATQQAEQAMRRAEQAERTRIELEQRNETLQRRHDLVQGSLRTFLRGYLPLLRRHLFGQRP